MDDFAVYASDHVVGMGSAVAIVAGSTAGVASWIATATG